MEETRDEGIARARGVHHIDREGANPDQVALVTRDASLRSQFADRDGVAVVERVEPLYHVAATGDGLDFRLVREEYVDLRECVDNVARPLFRGIPPGIQ